MPGKDKLLSICALGYRHAPFIRDCVRRVWEDPYPAKEIVAMDDGSKDGSVELLKELQAESPCPFTVLEQENSGNVPANFNKLLKAARGDYILFTSLDDMQIPGALEARMERLLADEKCAFAAHTRGFTIAGNSRELMPETTPASGLAPDPRLFLELERTQFHSFYIQGAVFRRDLVEAVQSFSEAMIGDDIVLRTKIFFHLLKHPELTFSLIEEPGFIYRRHPGNVSQDVLRQLKLAFQYCDRFWKDKPYPEMMKAWLLTGLQVEPYEKIIEIFAMNDRSSKYLLDKDVREELRFNAARSYLKEESERCA